MNAKEYLNQYQKIKAELDIIESSICDIQDEMQRIGDISLKSAWPDGQPHGTITTDPTGEKAVQIVTKYEEQYKELSKQLRQYEFELIIRSSKMWSKRMEILDTLSNIGDSTLYKILTYRYIDGKRFELIAVEIGYTFRHVIRLHGQALKKVEELINE